VCAICGIVEYERPVDRTTLERMARRLRHRGPDDEGYYVADAGERGPSVGLGFRRLAIIDLSGGGQPMTNEDGSLWLVFNGEIYNFRELRPELEAKGHAFRTKCDTEVIVHLYEEYGPDCVRRLNGMFAFAVWDTKAQNLFVARDRLGKKPLYYVDTGRQLLFASELKALLQHPACPRELDPGAVSKYLAYEYVPAPHTIFKGMRKLPAGHSLTWKEGRVTVDRYWDITFKANRAGRKEADYAAELHERLKEAVRLRLVSDVPLGVFLSGGIDSSSVVALMAELVPPEQIKTFSIGFAERSFDESGYARAVAEHFGTEHHERILRPETLLDVLPEVGAFLDEPFGDASIIPTYLLSKFTREFVTVALGGDGGDEFFAGYPTFQAHSLARWYRLPRVMHERMVVPLAERWPVSTDNLSLDFKLKRFLRGIPYRPAIRNQVWLGSFNPAEQRLLLNEAAPAGDCYEDIAAAEEQCDSQDYLERLIYLYGKLYLADDILFKVDRASMACSLEVRAPFLDYRLIEFVNSIPAGLKLKGWQTKYILKEAMRPHLPPAIVGRAKKGFAIPVAQWLKTEMKGLALELFSRQRLEGQGIFRYSVVARLLDEHFRGIKDNRKQLWTLLMFQVWYDSYASRS
jgi:asparagine synthase (glutamine-hydrolysing)